MYYTVLKVFGHTLFHIQSCGDDLHNSIFHLHYSNNYTQECVPYSVSSMTHEGVCRDNTNISYSI